VVLTLFIPLLGACGTTSSGPPLTAHQVAAAMRATGIQDIIVLSPAQKRQYVAATAAYARRKADRLDLAGDCLTGHFPLRRGQGNTVDAHRLTTAREAIEYLPRRRRDIGFPNLVRVCNVVVDVPAPTLTRFERGVFTKLLARLQAECRT
jgi:hypothetical protein